MMKISEKKIIQHSAQEIFEWINDIDAYQKEIPWCVSSGIVHQKSAQEVVGYLEFQLGPFRKKIITNNTLRPFEKIEMHLIEGPFHSFYGCWDLIPLDPKVTEVHLLIEAHWSEIWLEKLAMLSYKHLRLEALAYLEKALLRRKRL